MTLLNFDLNTVEDNVGNYEPIPPGVYDLQIADEIEKESAKGKLLQVTFMLTHGQPHGGRYVKQRYTIEHQNVKAQNIGRAQLKALCVAALGKPTQNMGELLGRRVKGYIEIDKPYTNAKGETYTNNVVKKVVAVEPGAAVGVTVSPTAELSATDDIPF